ncbi:uncharacterized protein BYT42DRAFT_499511, partial [Radiomyces spectabilis]|uniref:uncharacterized protein n=1 Tax=Radiomyces spectabilis TaxID=64574 RepID=UPI002220B9E4
KSKVKRHKLMQVGALSKRITEACQSVEKVVTSKVLFPILKSVRINVETKSSFNGHKRLYRIR